MLLTEKGGALLQALETGSLTHDALLEFERLLPTCSVEELALLSDLLRDIPPAPPYISFADFIRKVEPNYIWSWHTHVLVARLQDVADQKIEALMVQMPPRHGKTMTVIELFGAYYQYRFPFRWIGYATHTGDLAYEKAEKARDYYQKAGGILLGKDEADRRRKWRATLDGGMWATGVLGTLTGRGASLLLGDDLLKDSKESESATIRNSRIQWLQSTFLTRSQWPFSKVMVGTRWHPRDPMGYLFETSKLQDGIKWHVLNFEAIKTDEALDIPAGNTVEPDPRPIGQPLCEQLVPLRILKQIRATSSAYFWNAMYQGRPKAREGNRFKSAWFYGNNNERIVRACPASVRGRARFWDCAGTDATEASDGNDPDYTVGLRMARGTDGLYYIEAMERGQWSPGKRNARIRTTADADAKEFGGRKLAVRIGIESLAGEEGKKRTAAIVSTLSGYSVAAMPAVGSKDERAEPFATQAEIGNVRIVRRGVEDDPWIAAFIDEMTSFPFGEHDDVVDATSGAFDMLQGDAPPPAAVAVVSDYTELPGFETGRGGGGSGWP